MARSFPLLVAIAALLVSGAPAAAAVPANDAFADAIVLSGTDDAAQGSTSGATREPGEPRHHEVQYWDHGGESVWYRWTAPASGRATFFLEPAQVASVYTGEALGSLTRVTYGWDPRTLTFYATAGVTYRLAVAAQSSPGESFDLELELVDSPPNDHFANAQNLDGLAADAVGTLVGAGYEQGEPNSSDWDRHGSIWYRWVAPTPGTLTVTTRGSAVDTQLDLYSGRTLADLPPYSWASNDDADATTTSSAVQARIGRGLAVRIAVSGRTLGRRGDAGLVHLQVHFTPDPPEIPWEGTPPGTPPASCLVFVSEIIQKSEIVPTADDPCAGASMEPPATSAAGHPAGAAVPGPRSERAQLPAARASAPRRSARCALWRKAPTASRPHRRHSAGCARAGRAASRSMSRPAAGRRPRAR